MPVLYFRCKIKTYTAPDRVRHPRKCKMDFTNYVSACPEYASNWDISRKCSLEPAAFVYEGASVQQLQQGPVELGSAAAYMHWVGQFQNKNYGLSYRTFKVKRKFKNSFCASCNSAAWLGCKVKETFKLKGSDSAKELFHKYVIGARKYMFIYKIDYNKQLCIRDSDSYLLYPNTASGRDTCLKITENLHSCPCGSQLDLSSNVCSAVSMNCTQAPEATALIANSTTALNQLYEFRYSIYSKESCVPHFSQYDLLAPQPLLLRCMTDACSSFIIRAPPPRRENLSTTLAPSQDGECQAVFPLAYKHSQQFYSSIYCAASLHVLSRCSSTWNSTEGGTCLQSYRLIGVSGTSMSDNFAQKTLLQNSVAVSFSPTGYVFHIDEQKSSAGYDLLFSTFIHGIEGYCSEFSTVAEDKNGYLVCPNHILHDPENNLTHMDFYIQGDAIQLCTRYDYPGFLIEIQDYILSALSIVAIFAYLIHYAIKGEKTLTSYFVVSSLCTLVAALLCYCFVNQANPGTTKCTLIASLNQYLMLCTHSWTNSLAIWMYRGITRVRLVHDQRNAKLYVYYALYAWLAPLPFVVLAHIMHHVEPDGLYPVFSVYICFINSGWVRFLLFTGPIYLLVCINVILCIVAIVKVSRSGHGVVTKDKRLVIRKIITISKLTIVFGFHWFLMFFTLWDSDDKQVLWKILGVFISLQGVLVVLSQLVNVEALIKKVSNSTCCKNPPLQDSRHSATGSHITAIAHC